jgi:hypothetical protein
MHVRLKRSSTNEKSVSTYIRRANCVLLTLVTPDRPRCAVQLPTSLLIPPDVLHLSCTLPVAPGLLSSPACSEFVTKYNSHIHHIIFRNICIRDGDKLLNLVYVEIFLKRVYEAWIFLFCFCFLHRAPSGWLDIGVLCYTKMLLAKWLTRESVLVFSITIHSLPFTLLRTPSIVFSFYKWKLFNHWTFCRTADHAETHFWSNRCAQYRHDLGSGQHCAFHAVIHGASCGSAHGIIFHRCGLGDQKF